MMTQEERLDRLLLPEMRKEYEPLALLKEGAERTTILVQDRVSHEKLVLKRMLHPPADAEEKYALLARLKGSGLPRIHRFFRRGEEGYLLREYIEGETLLDIMQKHGPFSVKETAGIGLALCRTLDTLHSQNPPLIHRDIKAENIVRTPDGDYVLIDFDISRFYDEEKSRDTELRGTAFSAPPEQFGFRQTDPRSDIYALGVLLNELSTGENLLEKGDVPAPLKAAVERCTRFDPEDRYQNVAELARALGRVAREKRRNIAVPMFLALMLSLFSGIGVWAWQRTSDGAIYTFHSPTIEEEVCRQLQKEMGTVTRGDLKKITTLLLCGETPFREWKQFDVHGTESTLDGVPQTSKGAVDTLEDLIAFPNLTELVLSNQNITDISPLAESPVKRLSLHGNDISDIAPLESCAYLEELDISGNPVSDLSPLANCHALWNLNAGATQIENLDDISAIENLSFLWIHDCPLLFDVSALGSMEGLVSLSIRPTNEYALTLIDNLKNLEYLYIWVDDPQITDLTSLSNLSNITLLFVDDPYLTNLHGVESLTKLTYLDVRTPLHPDLSPLQNLRMLEGCNLIDDTQTGGQ